MWLQMLILHETDCVEVPVRKVNLVSVLSNYDFIFPVFLILEDYILPNGLIVLVGLKRSRSILESCRTPPIRCSRV